MTDAVIAIITGVAVVYDIIAVVIGLPTISEKMRDWFDVQNLWVLPFAWAVLFGHFWLNSVVALPHMGLRTVLVIATLAACLALNLTIVRTAPPIWLVGVGGLALGAILWAQERV